MKKFKSFLKQKKLMLGAFLLMSSNAMATTSNMPWVSTLDKLVGALAGPVARFAVIGAICVSGYLFMFGNFEGASKKLVGVMLGASLIFGAVSWAPGWFGYSGAVLM